MNNLIDNDIDEHNGGRTNNWCFSSYISEQMIRIIGDLKCESNE